MHDLALSFWQAAIEKGYFEANLTGMDYGFPIEDRWELPTFRPGGGDILFCNNFLKNFMKFKKFWSANVGVGVGGLGVGGGVRHCLI